MATQPLIISFDDCPAFSPVPGARMQGVVGTSLHANRVYMDPGAEVPEHSHANEQLGCVLAGDCTLFIQGQEHHLTAGMVFAIPPGVPHAVRAGANGCTVIDFFTPPRDDYPAARAGV